MKKTVLKKNYGQLLTAGVLASAVILVIYIIKGIYPFGAASVATQDMAHGYLPVYYHLYDFLHGEKSLFFDLFTGTGVNMAGIVSANGLLSPTNLILLLFPRDKLLEAMSFLLLTKLFLTGVSAQFFFQRRFPSIGYFWQTIFSLGYTLSGFCLFYYFHLIWLDLVCLFPLTVYLAERMLKGKSLLPLCLIMTANLLLSFYVGAMVLLCLFFVGGLYCLLFCQKSSRRSVLVKLGLSAVLPVLCSAFIVVPAYLQMSSSSRYEAGGGFLDIIGAQFEFDLDKCLLFVGLSLPAIFIIGLLAEYKQHRRLSLFALGSLFFMLSPFFIEGADLLWHFGSYKSFPMRFAFMSIFLVFCFAAVYIEKHGAEFFVPAKNKSSAILWSLATLLCLGAFIAYKIFEIKNLGSRLLGDSKGLTAFVLGAGALVVGICLFSTIQKLPSKGVRNGLILAICLLQSASYAQLCIGETSPLRYARAEHDVSYVERVNSVSEIIDEAPPYLRVRNPDMSLNVNYGFLLKRGCLSNWTHQIPQRLQDTAKALGYSTTYTLLLDTGGTAFSDALLGIKQHISMAEPRTTQLYSGSKAAEGCTVYDLKFTLPPAMLCSSSIKDLELKTIYSGSSSGEIFQNLNLLYSSLGGEGELFRIMRASSLPQSEIGGGTRYTVKTQGQEVVYLVCKNSGISSFEISVNGERIKIPSYNSPDVSLYHREYNNGVIDLGCFTDSEISIEITDGKAYYAKNDIWLGLMSTERLASICKAQGSSLVSASAGKRSFEYVVNSTQDKMVLLPICYDEGFSCRVNSQPAELSLVAGSLMAVPVRAGQSTIELSFTPSGLKLGIILSLLGIALTLFVYLLEKKALLERLPRPLTFLVELAFNGLFLLGIFLVYLLPFFYTLFNKN